MNILQWINPHQILGVAPGASKAAVKKAYLTMAKKFHPDLNKAPTAHSQFQKIQEAYSLLSNETYVSQASESSAAPTAAEPQPTRRPSYRESAGFPGGADAYWKYQTRTRHAEFAQEYARAADERARRAAQDFDRGNFEFHLLQDSLRKFLPIFFLPVALLVLALNLGRRLNSEPPEKFRVFFDDHGRAFAEDAFGQLVRAEPLDLRKN